jgi:lactoylglutathione lyase
VKLTSCFGATLLAVSLFLFPAALAAQQKQPQNPSDTGRLDKAVPPRPKILGVAHVAYYVSDAAKARTFYQQFLGFAEPFSLPGRDGGPGTDFIKINDEQYLEVSAAAPTGDGQLSHIAFYTDDAARMRDYLAAHGIKVTEKVPKGRTGNLNFTVTDPDGHRVEFVQYEPDSWTAQHRGRDMPATRVSQHMMHTGFTVGSVSAAMKFYAELLGFREFWRGSSDGTELSWINMRVPDGDDYVEFMLYRDPPSAERRGTANHICLVVPEIEKATAELKQRAQATGYTRAIEVRTGRNRKRQSNLFDADGTRVELMEPKTIDGQPTPSSTAAPPRP